MFCPDSFIEEVQLVHREATEGLTLDIRGSTEGSDWRQLRPGQQVACESEGENAIWVVRARLLPSELSVPAPGADERQTK